MSEISARKAAKTAAVGLFGPVGVFNPGLANLLEAIIVARSSSKFTAITSTQEGQGSFNKGGQK
jgi:hypothetical protein